MFGRARPHHRARGATARERTPKSPGKDVLLLENESAREFAGSLRAEINVSLANLGVLSAFMCALAAGLYSSPTEDGTCYGEAGFVAICWLEWFSMGFFFLSISMTVILAADLQGIPDGLLLCHLLDNQKAYAGPTLLTNAALFLLAAGFGIDVDERTSNPNSGCRLKWAGVVLAPMFPVVLFALTAYLRSRRRALNHYFTNSSSVTMHLGARWLNTWADPIPCRATLAGQVTSFTFLSHLGARSAQEMADDQPSQPAH